MTKLKKQIIAVAVLVAVAIALGVVYLVLLQDNSDSPNTEEAKGLFGETMKNGRPYIVDKIENEDMNFIKVHNTFGEYTLVHKKSGAYKIDGVDGYELNQTALAQLRVNSLSLLALGYVENAELDNLSQYGIDKDNPAVWFEVTHHNESEKYKIFVGDKTPDASGYYAMLEGRQALYVIDTGVESCILLPLESYIQPIIVDTVDTNEIFTLKDFSLKKNGEAFIEIKKSSGDLTYGNNSTHRLTYPAYNYATNLSNFDSLLSQLSNLSGTATLYFGDDITDELLLELGFFDAEGNDTSDYSFVYTYPNFSEYIYVMKDTESENYIVYSLKENIIVSVAAELLQFLDWDMLLWVSSEIYMLDIEDIASLVFESKDRRAEFKITGTGEGLGASCNNVPVDTDSFKELYRSIMYILATSYTSNNNYGEEQLRLVVTTEKGEELDYRFYAHTATNSYYTLNGFGEFYVSAEKILALREAAFDFTVLT